MGIGGIGGLGDWGNGFVAVARFSRKGPLTVLVSHTCAALVLKVVLLMATILVDARPRKRKRGKYGREKLLLPF